MLKTDFWETLSW